MKKVFIIISVIFTSLCLLLVLFVVGSMIWERFSNRSDDSDSGYYPSAPEVAGGYANTYDDDDTDDVTDYDGNSRYAEKLEATEIENMSPEYDNIRGALLFAADMFDLSGFPFIGEEGMMFLKFDDMKFETFDEYIEEYNDGRYGDTFGLLYKYAYRYRYNDLTGLDKWVHRFRKLIRLMIPHETYIEKGFDATVRQLLVAYDDLLARPGNFSRVYEVMTRDEWYASCDAYDEILPFVRDRHLRAFICESDENLFVEHGEVNKWSVVWAYSFWARRHNENPNNLKPIADALRILRDVYASAASTPKPDSKYPPVEPFLSSKLRPGETVYPWKMYTDRVEFVVKDNDWYSYIEVLHRGEKIMLINNFWDDDEQPFNPGDIIEITWCYELTCIDCDGETMRFVEFVRDAKLIN